MTKQAMVRSFLVVAILVSVPAYGWQSYHKEDEGKKGPEYKIANGINPSSFKTFDVLNPELVPRIYQCDINEVYETKKTLCDSLVGWIQLMNSEQKERFFLEIKKNLEKKGYVYDPEHPEVLVSFVFNSDKKTNYKPSIPVTIPVKKNTNTNFSGYAGGQYFSGSGSTSHWENQTYNFGDYYYDTYSLFFIVAIHDAKTLQAYYMHSAHKQRGKDSFKGTESKLVKQSLVGWDPKQK